MENKLLRVATVSVIIRLGGAPDEDDGLPPVVICGPDQEDEPACQAQGTNILELVYDHLRVVGVLVEEPGQKIIRVEIYQPEEETCPSPDTCGQPTLV